MPHKAIFYLEGPPPGVDILIDTVVVSSTSAKTVKVCIYCILRSISFLRLMSYQQHVVVFREYDFAKPFTYFSYFLMMEKMATSDIGLTS